MLRRAVVVALAQRVFGRAHERIGEIARHRTQRALRVRGRRIAIEAGDRAGDSSDQPRKKFEIIERITPLDRAFTLRGRRCGRDAAPLCRRRRRICSAPQRRFQPIADVREIVEQPVDVEIPRPSAGPRARRLDQHDA